MDPFDLINDLRQTQHLDSGLSTPTGIPSSPFSPASNATDKDIIERSKRANKERMFHRYSLLNYVKAIPAELGQMEDADDFYSDIVDESQNDMTYIHFNIDQGRAPLSDMKVESNVLSAYEVFDIHKEHQLHDLALNVSAARYDDSLNLKDINSYFLDEFDFVRFKNNLVENYKDFLFIGSYTSLMVLRNDKLVRSINLRPPFTTRRDRSVATWSYNPHTLNYIKISKLEGRDVLSCAIDDGRVIIYDIVDFFIDGTQMVPKYELKLSSSVWGIDTYKNMAVVSDNSQTVTLFYFEDNTIYHSTSNQIIHNIPDVAFICTDDLEDEAVFVSCVSISGEFIIFKYVKKTNFGPTNKPSDIYTVVYDTIDASLPPFSKHEFECSIFSRTVLQEDSWATHYIDEKYFLEVTSPEYLGARNNIDVESILAKSRTLNLMANHIMSSDLGGAAWYEVLDIDTYDRGAEVGRTLNRFTDKFRRVKKSYFSIPEEEFVSPVPKSPFHEKFLFVATATKVGLYRFNKLVCNATSGKLFDGPFEDEDLSFSNRLSITRVIPELSAVIAVCQAGFISIFRLVKHRGLHSMRLEHTISKNEETYYETILGLGVRKMEEKVFWLYVVYSHGRVFIYELQDHDETDSLCDTLVN